MVGCDALASRGYFRNPLTEIISGLTDGGGNCSGGEGRYGGLGECLRSRKGGLRQLAHGELHVGSTVVLPLVYYTHTVLYSISE